MNNRPVLSNFLNNINSSCKSDDTDPNNIDYNDNYLPINDIFSDYNTIRSSVSKELYSTEGIKTIITDYDNELKLLTNNINTYNNCIDNNKNSLLKDIEKNYYSLYKIIEKIKEFNTIKDQNLKSLFNLVTSKIIELSQSQYKKNSVIIIGIYDESFKRGLQHLKLDDAINLLNNIKNQYNKPLDNTEKTIVYIPQDNEFVTIENQNPSIENVIKDHIVTNINNFSNF